jgi:hypothetical protein
MKKVHIFKPYLKFSGQTKKLMVNLLAFFPFSFKLSVASNKNEVEIRSKKKAENVLDIL